MHERNAVLRVFLMLGSGEAVARLLHVAAFFWLARVLGKDVLGLFGLMVTVSSYLLILVQQGFDVLATREVSQSPGQVRRYAQALIGLRLMVAATLFMLVAAYAFLGHLEHTSAVLLLVFSGRYLATALSPQWSALAVGEPKPAAIAGVIAQAVFLAGVAAVREPAGVVWAAAAQVTGELLSAAYVWFWLSQRTGCLRPTFDAGFWRMLVKRASPITASVVLGNLLFNFDVLALGWLSTRSEIGLYLACYRCVTVFSPLMILLNNSVFPSFARVHPDVRAVTRLAAKAALPMLGGTLVLATGLTLGAPFILSTLYGASFSEGKTVLQVIVWVLPIQAVRNTIRQVLIAFHLETRDTLAMTFAVATNVGLDLCLARSMGGFGCAISTIVSEVVLLSMVLALAFRHLQPLSRHALQPAVVAGGAD